MSTVVATIWPLLAAPLLGAALAYLLGQRKKDLSGWIATAAAAFSFLWTVKLFFSLETGGALEDLVFTWFATGEEGARRIAVDFALRFDSLTAVMCLVVTGVGSLIHLYSIGYMAEDESRPRFFAYLNLFMFSMLTLVLGANLLVLFVGWEGVGLCSYLLIGFWFKNFDYARAGRKAFVVNRIGDAGFLAGIFILFQLFGTVDFDQLFELMTFPDFQATGMISLAALCLFVGAAGKSAQIPLFVWLPDAMAGPTPVSALIHAATMVTAGVYLLARMHFLFDAAPTVMALITLIAALTAFVAATTALVQNDIKKVLAYSTVSQLGFMFMAAGAGAYGAAIFHVVTHAFFKACLFLCAGSVIHGCHHEQDMRKMGGLSRLMPITFVTYLVSTLAIAGIYPFAGYQSKHAILAALENTTNPLISGYSAMFLAIATGTAILTAFYMTRSLVMTFFDSYRGHAKPHESPWIMTSPLLVLALLALGGGIALHHSFFEYLQQAGLPLIEAHPESILAALLHSWPGLLGVGAALLVYTKLKSLPHTVGTALAPMTALFAAKWYFDEVYQWVVVGPLERIARFLFREIDQSVIDGTVNGTAQLVEVQGELLRLTQTGQVRTYALFIFGGSLLLIVFWLIV